MFFRFGVSDELANAVKHAFNVAMGGKGIVPGRPDDTFGIGWPRVTFSDDLLPLLRQRSSTMWERICGESRSSFATRTSAPPCAIPTSATNRHGTPRRRSVRLWTKVVGESSQPFRGYATLSNMPLLLRQIVSTFILIKFWRRKHASHAQAHLREPTTSVLERPSRLATPSWKARGALTSTYGWLMHMPKAETVKTQIINNRR